MLGKRKRTNPFKPTAGAEPPVLAGRQKVIDDFTDGLAEGPGAPGRLMRITGPRGSGKTVLLTELGDIARKRGWLVVDVTARKGLCDELVGRLSSGGVDAELSADIDLGVFKAHAGMASADAARDFRSALTAAAGRCAETGVMVTVDEVQNADLADMTEIAVSVQHLIREKRNVAFVFAGITTGVIDFINDSALTFLRRAKAEELAAIPIRDVEAALKVTFEDTGLAVEADCLAKAAEATDGYAFMVQLVGYHVWRLAGRHADESHAVTMVDVDAGVREAFAEYDEAVIAPALAGLSERAMLFLIEMAKAGGSASTGEIAEGLGVPSTSLSSARKTLMSRQVVESPARGRVRFSVPRLKEYLDANADDLMARFE